MSIGVFVVLGVATLLFFVSGLMATDSDLSELAVIITIIGFVLVGAVLFLVSAANHYDEYYLPCEIVATNDTSTYFGTVDQDIQQIYAVETGDHIWPDDVPYLLHMDGKETKTVTDDEVLMVWRAD